MQYMYLPPLPKILQWPPLELAVSWAAVAGSTPEKKACRFLSIQQLENTVLAKAATKSICCYKKLYTMKRQQMHSLGWLVSASPASSQHFPHPGRGGSILCGLCLGFLMLSDCSCWVTWTRNMQRSTMCWPHDTHWTQGPAVPSPILQKAGIVLMNCFLTDLS